MVIVVWSQKVIIFVDLLQTLAEEARVLAAVVVATATAPPILYRKSILRRAKVAAAIALVR